MLAVNLKQGFFSSEKRKEGRGHWVLDTIAVAPVLKKLVYEAAGGSSSSGCQDGHLSVVGCRGRSHRKFPRLWDVNVRVSEALTGT